MAATASPFPRYAKAAVWPVPRRSLLVSAILLAATIPYLPFFGLPMISDSYLQIMLGRRFGPHLGDLANDALYRSRATSIWLTYLVDQVAGPEPWAHRTLSLAIHTLNAMLVALLGSWSRIGWRISIPAALIFAWCEVHQEAVIWSAAQPELLVFAFSVTSLITWIRWIQTRSSRWAAASLAAFVFALISKESAVCVIPLAGLIWLLEDRQWKAPLIALSGMSICAAGYAASIFSASQAHLHFQDGTFSLGAPFVKTIVFSTLRMMTPWGWVSLVVLCALGIRRHARLLAMVGLWVAITLLPYSFLTYMDRVPSRHTYFASVGLAILVASAVVNLSRSKSALWRTAALSLAVLFGTQNAAYLWTRKFDQYSRRAEPTERFLQFAAQSSIPIRVTCAPYGHEIFQSAASVVLGRGPDWVSGPDAPSSGPRRDFCDTSKP